MRIALTLLLVPLLLIVLSSYSADDWPPHKVTVRGPVTIRALDSSVGSANNTVNFVTDSEVGREIFSVCKDGDICEVTGSIRSVHRVLVSVSNVRLIANKKP